MKRREFLIGSAGIAGATLPLISRGASPCPPPTLTLAGGTSVSTACGTGSAEDDWVARSTAPGVVWYHDFRSDAEADNFRWSGGVGNDPLAEGANANWCRRITTDGITGGGCLELFRGAGSSEGSGWWRPFSPLVGSGNGRGIDDPGANGIVPARAYSPSQGSNAINSHSRGYYGHPSYHNSNFDGDEFYLQMRVRMDPRRALPGQPDVGKLTFLTLCKRSFTGQEIVTYSGGLSDGQNYFRMYGGWRVSFPLDGEVDPYDGHQPGSDLGHCDISQGGSTCWAWSGGWDTIMYHLVPGREGIDETLIEIYAAHPGDTSFTRIWRQSFAFSGFEEDAEKGLQALIASSYNNHNQCSSEFWQRFDQVIFSKEFIACPQV